MNHWIKFIELTYGADQVAGKILPPALGDVLAWSHTFRCACPFYCSAPHVYCIACQVLRNIFDLPGTSAHDLLCSGLRGASNRASLSQEGYDRHRQATNVPAEGTEAWVAAERRGRRWQQVERGGSTRQGAAEGGSQDEIDELKGSGRNAMPSENHLSAKRPLA